MNIYEPRPYEDPRDRRRTVPMQVLNLSFPRTGSMSLQAALNHLGYECFHSVTAFTPTPKECDLWVDAMERKYLKKEKLGKEDFDVLMPHCSAVSADVPAVVFAEELVDAYPEAKVILYERDVDKWFYSFSTGVIKDMWDPYYNFIAKMNPSFVGRLGKVHQTWARLWMGANNAEEHRAVAKKVYREHYDMMRRIVPKERLLEYEITDGWEPLCTFLNKPVPDIPFPRVNDADARKEMAATMVRKGLEAAIRKIGLYVSPMLVAGVVWYLYTHRS